MNLFLKDFLVVDPTNDLCEVSCVVVENGVITAVGAGISPKDNSFQVINGEARLVLMTGLVDMHVHLRDPGLTYKEDIISGCACGAAGGFVAVACMPNTKPTIDNVETIKYITEKAKETGVKVYPVACITKNMAGDELCDFEELKNAGAIAFSDDGRPVENAETLRLAMLKTKEINVPIISHCEDLNIIDGGIINKGAVSEKLGVKGMDRASEDSITAREIALSISTDSHIHIAHVSTKGSVEFIRDAKKNGYKVTAETAPHYFLLTEEKVLSKDADYRMNPPLRTDEDVKAVLEGVASGAIDCIVTDHAPHAKEEKADFLTAPNGVIGLETSLGATLTALYHSKKLDITKIAEIMSINPCKILNLPPFSIEVGKEANMTIIDLEKEWTYDPKNTKSKATNAVFKGESFKGKALLTIASGQIVYNEIY